MTSHPTKKTSEDNPVTGLIVAALVAIMAIPWLFAIILAVGLTITLIMSIVNALI